MQTENQTQTLRRCIEQVTDAAEAVRASPFVPQALKRLPEALRHLQAWVAQTDARLQILEEQLRGREGEG